MFRWNKYDKFILSQRYSGRNRATDFCNNSILQYQMGGALKILR